MRLPAPRNHPVVSRIVALVALSALGVLAYRAYGWAGIALTVGAVTMWVLVHMSRMLLVLRRTAQRPVGTVASAVMLHSRLSRGLALLQVLALAQALGERVGEGVDEQYQWTDASQASVRCTFAHGKLAHWELLRP